MCVVVHILCYVYKRVLVLLVADIQTPPTALEQCLTTQVRMLRYLSTVASIWFVFELSLSCSHRLQVTQRDAQSETWVVFEHWTKISSFRQDTISFVLATYMPIGIIQLL